MLPLKEKGKIDEIGEKYHSLSKRFYGFKISLE